MPSGSIRTDARDWWEVSPREGWQTRYEAELPLLIARTPKSIAMFLDNDAAAYARIPYQPRRPSLADRVKDVA